MNRQKSSLYNYPRFKLAYYEFDRFSGPKEGEPAPDFVLTTLNASPLKLSDCRGKIIILEMGSLTCTVYAEKIPRMNALAQEFPDCLHFLLYTREAHPADKITAHSSFENKVENAKCLRELENEQRVILIDDLEGTVHRLYGALPNSVYIIDQNGTVVFKDQWGSSDRARIVLNYLKAGRHDFDTQAIRQQKVQFPFSDKVKTTWRIFRRAGWLSFWDFAKEIFLAILKRGTKNMPY